MTKKDYIKFAEMLKHSRLAIEQNPICTPFGVQRAIERDIADIFMKDNIRFDYKKFMDYIDHK